MRKSFLYFAAYCVIAGAALHADARSFRVNLIPNGTKIDGIGCINCHFSKFGGGPRNAFGEAVEALVSPGASTPFWDAVFAAEDSDGDGATNGEELLDPNGEWVSGQADPGQPELVTNPGDATSVPETSNVAEWMLY